MCSLDELIDDVGLEFEAFSEGDCHDTGAHLVGLRPTESKVKDRSVERLEFWMASVVTYANNGNLY